MSDGILRATPKPRKSRKPKPKGLKRTTRMRQRNAKRQGSAFPAMRDPVFCKAVLEHTPCVGAGRIFTRAVSPNDHSRPPRTGGVPWLSWAVLHGCWGEFDPAHIGKHRAKGAPDRGHVVKMCRALHDFYDRHRSEFERVTGMSEAFLKGYAAQLVAELGGSGDPNP